MQSEVIASILGSRKKRFMAFNDPTFDPTPSPTLNGCTISVGTFFRLPLVAMYLVSRRFWENPPT